MKYTLAFALLAILSIGFASCKNETTATDMKGVPTEIQQEVNKNFTSKVITVTTEKNTLGNDEYKIVLADGTKVEYEGTQWEEVTVPVGQTVPEYFVMEPISKYVAANMPGQTIVKIERDKKGYEVKLANGVELKFDTAGKFLKVD